MIALQLARPRTFSRVDEPTPSLTESGWILVRLHYAMVCGSDLPFFSGQQYRLDYPLLPGMFIHECSGRVTASTSARFSVGDRVVALPHEDRGLREIFPAREDEAVRLPDTLDDMELAVLIQPLSTVLFALDKLGTVTGHHVEIIGAGPIGLLTCWLLRERQAASIRVIDPVASRCRLAMELGATDNICATSTEVRALHRSGLMQGSRPDLVVEAVGHQQTTINDSLALVRNGGTVLALGVPETPVYAFEYELFFRNNICLIGSVTPDWATYLVKAAELMGRFGEELRPLVTHRFTIDQATEAFTLAESRGDGTGKIVIDARHWPET